MCKGNVDLLLVGQTPPPFHGQAVVTAMLFDHDWSDLKVERLRMAYSDSIDEVGKASLGKIIHLVSLVLSTWWIILKNRPRILYYLPASANKAPVIRDIIYLGCVRWFFPKIVYHYHAGGLPEFTQQAGILGRLAQLVYKGADVSVEICHTDVSPGEVFEAKRTVLVPNGLDIVKLNRMRSQETPLRCLFLGALNEGKGVLQIVETAALLKDSGKHVQFQLVGAWVSDSFKEETLQLIREKELDDYFDFPGVLKGNDKWQAYVDAELFIFPTHYQSENFPLVLIEAMACGLPVISTRWRGIPQLVENSDAAILCDVRKPSEYAGAVVQLLEDKDMRCTMGGNAVRHYESHFTRQKFIDSMNRVFTSLLAGHYE